MLVTKTFNNRFPVVHDVHHSITAAACSSVLDQFALLTPFRRTEYLSVYLSVYLSIGPPLWLNGYSTCLNSRTVGVNPGSVISLEQVC